jgi:hypothetical protein
MCFAYNSGYVLVDSVPPRGGRATPKGLRVYCSDYENSHNLATRHSPASEWFLLLSSVIVVIIIIIIITVTNKL